jgi:plasmid stabilization system protein ParE
MAAKIYQAASERILDIWDYTERTWGEAQADKYVIDLVEAINGAQGRHHQWRSVMDIELSGVYFIRHQHHYVFFRELSSGELGVISILHENMDIPARLREDSERPPDH